MLRPFGLPPDMLLTPAPSVVAVQASLRRPPRFQHAACGSTATGPDDDPRRCRGSRQMSFSSASQPSVLGLFAQVKVKPKPKPKPEPVTGRARSLSLSFNICRLRLTCCGLRHSTDLDIEVGLALATISWANITTEIDRKHRKPKTIGLHLMPLAHIDHGEAF